MIDCLNELKFLRNKRRSKDLALKGLSFQTLTSDSTLACQTTILTFAALYSFLRPRSGFQLNYYNGYTNAPKHPSYVVSRGRPRNLNEIDELFLTMNRLRLGLLEKDLADRFNIK